MRFTDILEQLSAECVEYDFVKVDYYAYGSD